MKKQRKTPRNPHVQQMIEQNKSTVVHKPKEQKGNRSQQIQKEIERQIKEN